MASAPTATAVAADGAKEQHDDNGMRFGTVLTHLSRPGIRIHGFVNPPVQRGSTVIFPTVQARNDSWHQRKRFEQGGCLGGWVWVDGLDCRGGVGIFDAYTHTHGIYAPPTTNPPHPHTELTYGICGTQTHYALEDMVARIEGGTRCQITSSGLSACTIALLAFLKAGDHCLLPDSVYGPVRGFCDGFLRRFGVEVEYYHASATVSELEGHFKPHTRVLYIESPGK
jgi:cysteine-S-conjugate beta-lyase